MKTEAEIKKRFIEYQRALVVCPLSADEYLIVKGAMLIMKWILSEEKNET
jgi:hypothetical protein